MFENLKEKIMGASVDTKMEKKLVQENADFNRYKTRVISLGDSAYMCSMGARICYGLKVDEAYSKNRSHISRIVGMGHDSVSAHSNVIFLIELNGDCTEELLDVLPALKYMNIVYLPKVIPAENEDDPVKIEMCLLVSGSVRAFRYFFMTYDFYNTEISSLAKQFVDIAKNNFEKEFFESLLIKSNLFKDQIEDFDYFAPLSIDIVNEKNPETGEMEELATVVDDDSHTIHFVPVTSSMVDIVYADYIVGVIIELVETFPNIDKEILMKAAFDTCIVTTILHDYSRAISQQINRHQSGISQESQRYVDYSTAQFVDPTQFNTEKYDPSKIYDVKIAGNTITGTSKYIGEQLQQVYPQLREQGMLPQDARSFLPFNVKTKTMHTWTLTNFLHFIKVRTPKAAQPEVREIAYLFAETYKKAVKRMVDEVEEESIDLAKEIGDMIIKHIESLESKE